MGRAVRSGSDPHAGASRPELDWGCATRLESSWNLESTKLIQKTSQIGCGLGEMDLDALWTESFGIGSQRQNLHG